MKAESAIRQAARCHCEGCSEDALAAEAAKQSVLLGRNRALHVRFHGSISGDVEYPPLLPPGLHPKTWAQLEDMCVASIPLSTTRVSKFAGFRKMVDRLSAAGIVGDIWVDGSFLTSKIDPGDLDFALRLDMGFLATATNPQKQLLAWIGTTDKAARAEIKRDYSCDPYVFCDIPASDPGYPGVDMREYWLKQFGLSRSGTPKGIAVLSIPGGVV